MPEQIRITYIAPSGLRQTWDMRVAEPVTSEQILAQLRDERPDIQSVASIERINGVSMPRGHRPTRSQPSQFRPVGSRNPRTPLIAAIVVAFVVIAIIAAVALSNQRDAESYQAGQDAGDRFAGTYNQLTSDGQTDDQLRLVCTGLVPDDSEFLENEFKDFDRDDFLDGCFAAVRSRVG